MESDGKFKPGNPGKPKGATSHVSTKVKESIVKFLEDNVDQIQASFNELKPAQKLDFIAQILPYAAPKLQATQLQIDGELTLVNFKDAE